jgi:hypothetical protein
MMRCLKDGALKSAPYRAKRIAGTVARAD